MQSFFDVPGGPDLPSVGLPLSPETSEDDLPLDGSERMTGGLDLVRLPASVAPNGVVFADASNGNRPSWKDSSGTVFDLTNESAGVAVANAPTLVGDTSADGSLGPATIPSGWQVGDVAIGIAFRDNHNTSPAIQSAAWTSLFSDSTDPTGVDVYGCLLDETEAGLQLSGPGHIAVYRNASPAISDLVISHADHVTDSVTFPEVNTVRDSRILAFCYGAGFPFGSTDPAHGDLLLQSGYTIIGDAGRTRLIAGPARAANEVSPPTSVVGNSPSAVGGHVAVTIGVQSPAN